MHAPSFRWTQCVMSSQANTTKDVDNNTAHRQLQCKPQDGVKSMHSNRAIIWFGRLIHIHITLHMHTHRGTGIACWQSTGLVIKRLQV